MLNLLRCVSIGDPQTSSNANTGICVGYILVAATVMRTISSSSIVRSTVSILVAIRGGLLFDTVPLP